MQYLLIICLIIIGILIYQVYSKKKLDRRELEIYQNQIDKLREELAQESETIERHRQELTDLIVKCGVEREELKYLEDKQKIINQSLKAAREEYEELTSKKMLEIDSAINERREQREQELERELQTKKDLIDKSLKEVQHQTDEAIQQLYQDKTDTEQWAISEIKTCQEQAAAAKEKLNGIIEALALYDKEQQERLFYTIQLPEEYQDDIEYLLTSVSQKVQHPDIISKLVWAEYVKPNLDETFKRIQIKSEPGIYKLTSLKTGKPYIGKSTDVKKRIADHFKSAVGIKSIADQAVHHAILKEGFWNWSIEVITYCDKEKLNDLEKYYIETFKTQEFGWNKNSGGGG